MAGPWERVLRRFLCLAAIISRSHRLSRRVPVWPATSAEAAGAESTLKMIDSTFYAYRIRGFSNAYAMSARKLAIQTKAIIIIVVACTSWRSLC